jgi:hypothetical protein
MLMLFDPERDASFHLDGGRVGAPVASEWLFSINKIRHF